MKKIISRNLFLFLSSFILLIATVIIYLPSLRLNFLLIDDGQIVLNSKKIIQSISTFDLRGVQNILFESNEGRVRPVYWLIQAVISFVTFYSVQLMHLARLVILFTNILLIYMVLKKLKIDLRWILFSVFLFIFNFQNFENFYRLGPTEIFLCLYFLINLNVLLKDKISKGDYILTLIVTFLGSFTKETFFLTSIPVIYLLFLKNNQNLKLNKMYYIFVLTTNVIFTALVFLIKNSYGVVEGYSQNYKFSIESLTSNSINYFNQITHYQSPVFTIVILATVIWIFRNYRNIFNIQEKGDVFFIFLVMQIGLNLAILLPWQFVLGRYLIIVNLSIIIAFAIFLEYMWRLLPNLFDFNITWVEIAKNLFMLALMPLIFIRNIFPIANFQEWQRTDSELTTSLLKSISTTIPKNETVYVNYVKGDANIEIYLETKWHLEEFYSRSDIKFNYLDEANLCTKTERFILDRSAERFLQKSELNLDSLVLIDSGKFSYNPVVYGEVLKSFSNLYRSDDWNQSFPFEWNIYRQKQNTCIKLNNNVKK